MTIFTQIKSYLYTVFSILFIALLAALKWYKSSSEEKAEKIQELKKHLEVSKKLNDENMKVREFNARQELKKDQEDAKIAKHNKEAEDAKKHIDDSIDSITI